MKRKINRFVGISMVLSLVLGISVQYVANATVPGANTLVSVNNTGDGQGGNGISPSNLDTKGDTTISANGRYVVFTSRASNLVSNDTNSQPDVFVRDLVNNTTTRVNVSSSGVQANSDIFPVSGKLAAISSTGRYVVFPSRATNLIDGQTISTPQLYMRDTLANTTTIVSQKSDGTLGGRSIFNSIGGVSDDGRFVTWSGGLDANLVSTETNTQSYYVYFADLKTRTFTALNHTTPATGQYFVDGMTMSCDGSLVAFASKLQLDSNDTGSADDIYLVDTRNGLTTTGITTSSSAGHSVLPSLSCNGEYVVFVSANTPLITSGPIPTDNNSHHYLYDRINGTVSLVDTSTSGVVGNNDSNATTGVDDQGNVVFSSTATNLIDGHTFPAGSQAYLKHKDTGQTELISRTPGGSASSFSNSYIVSTSLSADGKTTVYATLGSTATNLISSDTNGFRDVIASSTGL